MFEPRDSPETTAQLQQMAERYDALAAKERRAVESSTQQEGDGAVNPTLYIAALCAANQNSALWSFRVPVSVRNFFLKKELLINISPASQS